MKLVHLADLHLGFRQYSRVAPNGVNQREVDVAQTASRAIDAIISESPDIVVIGGDVFHVTRPTNNTIMLAFGMFLRLRKALPNTPIVIVSGNHDAPKTADQGNILGLFKKLGNCFVVETAAECLSFPALQLDMLCVPDVIGIERPELKPRDPTIKHRVLLMHGEIAGVMPIALPHDIPLYDLHADEWSYIALGHYHVYREVAPRTYYSGSLDFTSSNPWGELEEMAAREVPGKGFIVQDLESGTHRFVTIEVARPWAELPVIDCATLTNAEVDAQMRISVETTAGGIDNRVVRVVLKNMTRSRLHELDQQAIKEYKGRALQFQIDIRKPDAQSVELSVSNAAQRVTLADTVGNYLAQYPIAPDVARAPFVALGLQLLDEASNTGPAIQLVEA